MSAPDSSPLFGNVALIGIGLIGSSMAHAMRRANLAGHIAGYARRPETRAVAEKIGFADSLHGDLCGKKEFVGKWGPPNEWMNPIWHQIEWENMATKEVLKRINHKTHRGYF